MGQASHLSATSWGTLVTLEGFCNLPDQPLVVPPGPHRTQADLGCRVSLTAAKGWGCGLVFLMLRPTLSPVLPSPALVSPAPVLHVIFSLDTKVWPRFYYDAFFGPFCVCDPVLA